ncbi:MAG: transposase [Chthoniobacteraceae bacterium]
MKRYRHSAAEIMSIMKQIQSSGLNIGDACEIYQIARMTYYRWQKKYPEIAMRHMPDSKMTNPEKYTAPPLASENAELKIIVAEQMLAIRQLKEKITRAERLVGAIKDKHFTRGEWKLANAMENSTELCD